jgi:hypothetical protein
MVATYVYSVTVAGVRKIAKQFAVKQSDATRSQLRGILFAAAVERVANEAVAEWQNILGEECVAYITDPTNQVRAWNLSPSD